MTFFVIDFSSISFTLIKPIVKILTQHKDRVVH